MTIGLIALLSTRRQRSVHLLVITCVYRYKDEEEVALILKNYEQNLKEAKKIFFDHVEKVDLAKEVTALILIALVVLFSWLVVWGREGGG